MNKINQKKVKQHTEEINDKTVLLYFQDASKEAQLAAKWWFKKKINHLENVRRRYRLKIILLDALTLRYIKKHKLPIIAPARYVPHHYRYTVTSRMIIKSLIGMGLERKHIKEVYIIEPKTHTEVNRCTYFHSVADDQKPIYGKVRVRIETINEFYSSILNFEIFKDTKKSKFFIPNRLAKIKRKSAITAWLEKRFPSSEFNFPEE